MITTLVYRDNRFAAHNPPEDLLEVLRDDPRNMLWIDLNDPTDEEVKLVLEELFHFHPLVIEDCTTDNPLPKLEEFDDYLFLVMHAVDYSKTDKFSTTELDIMLGKNFIVTLHWQPLVPVETAMGKFFSTPNLQVRGPDRFAHTLLDFMVEAYQPATEELRNELEEIEEAALRGMAADELFQRVIDLRKELAQLRQIVKPQREVASSLATVRRKLIRPLLAPYLRDLAEELGRLESQASSWADQLMLSFRVYLNKSSHEANEGIRVITGLTALTIPPLLIGGWFGMNFRNMGELKSGAAYPLITLLTLGCVIFMVIFLRRRNWL